MACTVDAAGKVSSDFDYLGHCLKRWNLQRYSSGPPLGGVNGLCYSHRLGKLSVRKAMNAETLGLTSRRELCNAQTATARLA